MNTKLDSLRPSGSAPLPAPSAWSRSAPRPRNANLLPLNTALKLDLPTKVGRRAASGSVEALCLGPDEWILHAPEADAPGLQSACAAIYADHPHSLVDVSAREVTFVLEGARASELLSIGCPRNIDTINVGSGCRTVFDGTAVVLWREAADKFRMDCWHSFAPHVLELLEVGCRELDAEAA